MLSRVKEKKLRLYFVLSHQVLVRRVVEERNPLYNLSTCFWRTFSQTGTLPCDIIRGDDASLGVGDSPSMAFNPLCFEIQQGITFFSPSCKQQAICLLSRGVSVFYFQIDINLKLHCNSHIGGQASGPCSWPRWPRLISVAAVIIAFEPCSALPAVLKSSAPQTAAEIDTQCWQLVEWMSCSLKGEFIESASRPSFRICAAKNILPQPEMLMVGKEKPIESSVNLNAAVTAQPFYVMLKRGNCTC